MLKQRAFVGTVTFTEKERKGREEEKKNLLDEKTAVIPVRASCLAKKSEEITEKSITETKCCNNVNSLQEEARVSE